MIYEIKLPANFVFFEKAFGRVGTVFQEIVIIYLVISFFFHNYLHKVFCIQASMASLSLKQRLMTLRELIANGAQSSLLLQYLDHLISNSGGSSRNEKDQVIVQLEEKLRIQQTKCWALKKSLKLAENDVERLRYDLEGSRIKSQNLEKDLKELRQKVFKEKMLQSKEDRRIFRGKMEQLRVIFMEVQSLISISRISEAKNKIQICLNTVQEYKLNKNCIEADYSKEFDEISTAETLDVSFFQEKTLSLSNKRKKSEHSRMFNLCWKNSGCNILQPLDQ